MNMPCSHCLQNDAKNTEVVFNTEDIQRGGKRRVFSDIVHLCQSCLTKLTDEFRASAARFARPTPTKEEVNDHRNHPPVRGRF
jgi:hypothetical protein